MSQTDTPSPDKEWEEADREYRLARNAYNDAKSRFIEADRRRDRVLRDSSWAKLILLDD